MGYRDLKKRLTASIDELDALRLQERYVGLGLSPIDAVALRQPARVGGEITRLRTVTHQGASSLEVTLSDGTGDIVAIFSGRKNIGGLGHGRGVVVEGVAYNDGRRKVILNPAYTLLQA